MQVLNQGDVHMENAKFTKTMVNQGTLIVSTQRMETFNFFAACIPLLSKLRNYTVQQTPDSTYYFTVHINTEQERPILSFVYTYKINSTPISVGGFFVEFIIQHKLHYDAV
jgi:hypothetical protein